MGNEGHGNATTKREKATMENPEDDAPVHDRVDEAAAKRICMPKSLES